MLNKIIDYGTILILIVGIISLGTLAVNQSLEYYYKAEFLGTPCDLCSKLNPWLEECFEEASIYSYNKITGEIIGGPELIKEINKRKNKNYTYFEINYSLS